jgi:hypothetical protein
VGKWKFQFAQFTSTATLREPFVALIRPESLQLQVSEIGRHRQYAQRIGVAKATLPTLHRDHSRAALDDIQRQCASQAKSNAIVDLDG